jgi:hypothetical protein
MVGNSVLQTHQHAGIVGVMFVYAGIDEAGYGPLLGPLIVGRSVLVVPKLACDAPTPDLWLRLNKAVCKRISDRAGRLAVNDSKKLTSKAAGVKHLELGCLAFAGLSGSAEKNDTAGGNSEGNSREESGGEAGKHTGGASGETSGEASGGKPGNLCDWLDMLGETTHRAPDLLPWYTATDEHPWQTLPTRVTQGEVAVAGGMLGNCAGRIGVELGGLGAAVVFEDRFNKMVSATRSKASVSFTFVAGHLLHVWETYGQHSPTVIVDRQGGRTRYRELLAQNFPDAQVDVIEESQTSSAYALSDHGGTGRSMSVSFMVDAEESHMPVALASMVSKYTRELLMARLNHYFAQRIPGLKPTAGYAKDGKRYLTDLTPHLPDLGLDLGQLRRIS